MSYEPVEAPEPQDQLHTESEAPEVEVGTSEHESQFEAPFNINDVPEDYREHVERYNKQVQSAYTKKTQELAEQRKTYEEIGQWYESLRNDPEAQYAFYQELEAALDGAGYFNEGEEVEEAEPQEEFHDPRLDPILEQLEAAQQEQLQQEVMEQRLETIAEHIDRAGKSLGDLSDSELEFVLDYAMRYDTENGVPATEHALDRLKAMRTENLNRYIESKKAPRLSPGVPGSEKLDLNNDEVRRQFMLDQVQAAKQQ